MKKYIIFLMLLIVSSFSLVQAETFGYGRTEDIPINYSTIPIVNSSDYWDDLDTPADITYDEISGGDVNALGYTGTFNFIKGVGGQLSMDGNPWYLGGTDLELGQNLTVDGNSYLSDTYPRTTLTYSLGSGALRWLKLWVQNISAEYIDTFNLYVNENITVDGFINGINISNLSNTYLPLAGGNMTGDIDMGGNDITNVVDPTLDQDAATKKYVDDNIIPAVTDYWKTTTAQTGLTGDKTGSFDFITTGSLKANNYDGAWITPADDRTKVTVEQVALYGGAIIMPKLRGSATAGLTQTALGLANGVYVYADSGQDPSILLTNAGVTDILTMKYTLATHILSYSGSSVLGYTFDNDVEIDGNLNVTGNITTNQIYAGMWYHNHTSTSLNFAVDGTFYNMFMPNATHLNGFSYQGGFNQLSNLTAQVGGVYKVDYMSSGDGQNNHAYYTSVFINGANQDNCESHHKMSAGGDIITQSGNCIITLDVDDVVDVRTADIGSTGTGNYYSANINLVRIGD